MLLAEPCRIAGSCEVCQCALLAEGFRHFLLFLLILLHRHHPLLRYPVILDSPRATGDRSEAESSLVNGFCAGSVSQLPSVSPLSALRKR